MEFTERDKLFGSRIKQLRRLHRLTQSELGEMVGLTQQSITAWETGRSYPDVYTLIRLAEKYQVSVDWLLGLSETAEPSRLVLRRTAEGQQQDDIALAQSLSPELQEAIKALMRVEARKFYAQNRVAELLPPLYLDVILANLRGEEPKP